MTSIDCRRAIPQGHERTTTGINQCHCELSTDGRQGLPSKPLRFHAFLSSLQSELPELAMCSLSCQKNYTINIDGARIVIILNTNHNLFPSQLTLQTPSIYVVDIFALLLLLLLRIKQFRDLAKCLHRLQYLHVWKPVLMAVHHEGPNLHTFVSGFIERFAHPHPSLRLGNLINSVCGGTGNSGK